MLGKLLTHKTLLFTIWVLAILLRLQNFFLLPIDAHPMRQTDTESVAYYFATVDANPLHPQASLIRPQSNIHGYFFLEVPAYQYLLSIAYQLFGTGIVVARVFNLMLFSMSFWLVYKFVRNLFSRELAVWAVLIYSLIPSSLFFFGHAIHPDLFAITTVLTALYLQSKQQRSLFRTLVAGLFFAIAVGTRPFILMALPSLFVTTYFKKGKWWEYIILLVSSLSIYGLWTWWQTFFPEADHSWQYWTLQGREVLYTFEGIKFLLWRNVSGEVVGRVASGLTGVGILAIVFEQLRRLWHHASFKEKAAHFFTHLMHKPDQLHIDFQLFLFCLPWLAAVPVYWFVAPAGNAAHQYYANVFVLPIIFLAARGAVALTHFTQRKWLGYGTAILIFAALLYNGLRTSSYFYNNIIPESHVQIAKEIEAVILPGNKLGYLAFNNSVPFSLAHRQGWMLGVATTDVDRTAESVLGMQQYGAKYAVWAKDNNDMSEVEMRILEEKVLKIYESDNVKIYEMR